MKKTALTLALLLMLTACSDGTVSSVSSTAPSSSEPALAQVEEAVKVEKAEKEMKTREESSLYMITRSAEMMDRMGQEGNLMLSPLSLYSALGMTMNGAGGNTLLQMEETLGMTVEELNAFCAGLTNTEELKTANSIWYAGNEVKPQSAFQERVETDYRAEIFGSDFSDKATVDKVNNWVSENTDKMIPKLLDQIEDDTVMMLINTTLFDGVWVKPYEEYQIAEESFYLADGTEKTVDLMASSEGYYFENDAATGFMKYYENNYRFVAVLPKEEGDFTLESLSLDTLLASMISHKVNAKMPSFTFESSMSFAEILGEMGMPDAFGSNADFSGLLEDSRSLFISEILQKSKIDLTAEGTKAAAATVVSVMATAARPSQEIVPKEVILNRPFAFVILDPEGAPLFLGKVMDPAA